MQSGEGIHPDMNLSVDVVSPRVLHIVTSSLTVALMRGQLRYLRERGFDVTVISSPGRWLGEVSAIQGARTVEVPLAREISPLKDLVSLWRLWRLIRSLRPTVTNVSTPKAGLLGGLAAWLNGVPCRVYTLRGLRFETTSGLRRRLLIFAERLACRLAHCIICVSESLREQAVAFALTERKRTVVLGSGSSNGVDESRFAPTPDLLRRALELRRTLRIPPEAPVVGFVGRLTRDKGIPELVEAYSRLLVKYPSLRLLLVGGLEDDVAFPEEICNRLEKDPNVILPGLVEDTAPYYAIMDILALPTHREGFPNVSLEAHAAGKPVVAARVTGSVDAIVDGVTGFLFPVGSVTSLAEALERLLTDKTLAMRMGCAGRERVKREFRQEQVWAALCEEYLRLLQRKALPHPKISEPKHAPDFVSVRDE